MAIRDIFKVSRKTFFNPRAWLNYDEYKNQNQTLWRLLKNIFIPRTPAPINEETFEQAMARNDMSEADVAAGIIIHRRSALLFTFLGVLTFIYAFLLLFAYASISGWVLALCVCALLLAQAFKYDFWSLQLRRRKLNLSFNEWLASILGKSGGEK